MAMIGGGCASAQGPAASARVDAPPALPVARAVASAPWPALAVARARAAVDTLTSDAFAGRGYDAARGADRAARWAAARMAATPGVRPLLAGRPTGSPFLHPFTFDAPIVERAGLVVGGRALVLGTDALPLVASRPGEGAGTAAAADAGDLRGRVAVVATSDSLDARLTRAARAGAVAAVVLVDALPPYGRGREASPVPAFFVRREAWPGTDAAPAVRFALDVRAESAAGASARVSPIGGANVVGVVPGTAVPDSFVVLTAHLDHHGRILDAFGGAPAVFRGANDNASGSAAALALLDTLARRPLRYSVVVVLTGAEEQGLVGAEALAASPPWPLGRTALALNLDMVASGETGIGVFGAPEQPARFARMQDDAARLGAGPLVPRAMRPNSDQYAFSRRGVPALYLLGYGGRQPYHATGDVAATLEWDDWAAIVALTHATLRHATGDAR